MKNILKQLLLFIIITHPLAYSSQIDNCLNCHKNTTNMSKSHPTEKFGCFKCHGGNKEATNKKDAHRGMVLNPSRLEHAHKFCGKCHEDIIKRVSRSLMNSQKGIFDVLKFQWDQNHTRVSDINFSKISKSHFRKACAACHINQHEELFDDPQYAKGGGCVDCHRVSKTIKHQKDFKLYIQHSQLSTKIPSKNCLKCHNRSNRVGLSYFGKFESEGYGTPYKKGEFSHKLDNSRYYYQLPPDIHYKNGQMDCIDCHTEKGVMGDGKSHAHMEEAEDIKCIDCHKPKFKKFNKLAKTLQKLNEKIPKATLIAYSNKKNSPIYNLEKNSSHINFYRKKDAKLLNLSIMSDKAYHTSDIHKRLDCSACHSLWMPSCYGCHEVYFDNGKQFDWFAKKVTSGEWQELRSFLRFESPSLGIGYNKKIMPFAPGCQVIGTLFEDKKIKQFHSLAMAGWSPHTIQKQSRECIDCHFNPASLGLGRGNLDIKDQNITFRPIYNSQNSGMPFEYPIDAFVSTDGKQFQSTSREEARGFNKDELHKIINAYKCIICHREWNDKIYIDFNRSKQLFLGGKTQCSK